MIHKILILGSVLAITGVAQAASINVSFQGKSDAVVRADLLKAAKQVCKEASDPFTTESNYHDCVSDTYADALHQLKHALAAGGANKLAAR